MFIAILFVVTRLEKPKFPSVRTDKINYICTIEYYSTRRKNEIIFKEKYVMISSIVFKYKRNSERIALRFST